MLKQKLPIHSGQKTVENTYTDFYKCVSESTMHSQKYIIYKDVLLKDRPLYKVSGMSEQVKYVQRQVFFMG